jgi:SPP1 gp7 family putative phage head morphogenesis protein
MSATSPSRTAHLAQPSGTEAIEEDFLRAVNRRARTVRGLVRRTVGYENDALGLRQDARLAEDREHFPTSSRIRGFSEWFQTVLRDELLEPLSFDKVADGDHWSSEFIRRAYLSAWEQAGGQLRSEGFGAEVMGVEAVIQLPASRRQLRRLYQRTYRNLRGISTDMAETIRRELTRGLAAGENPRKMARRLNKEIGDVTRTRLETLARTEVIHSHTTATLDRFERAGAETVQHGEWADADDSRVCPICSFLDGNEYSISEFRTETFEFEPSEGEPDHLAGTYPLAPPAHPNCRCTILPVIS